MKPIKSEYPLSPGLNWEEAETRNSIIKGTLQNTSPTISEEKKKLCE